MLSGRTGRTLPDGSVWKGALLVQSRQQPIRVPAGFLCMGLGLPTPGTPPTKLKPQSHFACGGHDLLGDVFALLLTLFLQLLGEATLSRVKSFVWPVWLLRTGCSLVAYCTFGLLAEAIACVHEEA